MDALLSKLLRQTGLSPCDRCCLSEDTVPTMKSLCCSPSGKTGGAMVQKSVALLGNRSCVAKSSSSPALEPSDSAINSALTTFVRTFLRGTRIEVLLDDGSSIWPQVSLDYDITTLHFDLEGVRTSISLGDVTHICFPDELPQLTDLHLIVEPYLTDACCVFVTRGSGSLACRFQNSRLCDYFTTCMQLLVSKAKSSSNSPHESQPESSRTEDASWTPTATPTPTPSRRAPTRTDGLSSGPRPPLHDDELEVASEQPEVTARPPTPSAQLTTTSMRANEEVY